MSGPIERLRGADPAASLHLDARAEADLALLLDEPRSTPPVAASRPRRRLAPILVTAVVALAVIALTAAVLGTVRPRTDVGGTPASITPTLDAAGCHPAQVLPFQCGTYRSTYGGKAITGDGGGPAKDRLSISFTQHQGGLLLSARTDGCFAEQVLVRYDGKRLIRIGTPTYGQNDCFGEGVDTRSWAYAFLRGPLTLEGTDGPYFGKGDSSVFFEFQGAAPLGSKQLPRNDMTCVAEHIAPFSCATYFSSGGTGAVAFLSSDLFRLAFDHLNGQLVAELSGRCNSLGVVLQPDGDTVVTHGASSTAMGCGGASGAQDDAILKFFTGTLTYRLAGDTVEFESGSTSAVFTSGLAACQPKSSPFCGSYHSTGGNGPVAFLTSTGTKLTFGQQGPQLTATVQLNCGTRTYAMTIDRNELRFRQIGITDHSCPESAAARDGAVDAFLRAGVTWGWDHDRGALALEKAASGPASSATFSR